MYGRAFRLLVLGLQCAAAAPAPAAAQALAQNQADQPDQEKKICRRVVPTGSVMAKSVCHTKLEWMALKKQDSGEVDLFRNRRQDSVATQ